MVKTIKFNLILDGQSVRTLTELKQNFVIEDMLSLYHKGLLQKWLQVRAYHEEYQKVINITSQNDQDIIKELINIFAIECDATKVEESIQILQFRKERSLELAAFAKQNFKMKSIIEEYHQGYEATKDCLISHKHNMPYIKATVKELAENYLGLFALNYYELYQVLKAEAPLAIFAILMNKTLREYFMNSKRIRNEISQFTKRGQDLLQQYKTGTLKGIKRYEKDTNHKWHRLVSDKQVLILDIKDKSGDVKVIGTRGKSYSGKEAIGRILDGLLFYSYVSSDAVEYVVYQDEFKEKYGDNIKVYRGDTEAYWKDVELNDKKYLILSMEEGSYIRSQGNRDEEFSSKDVNGNFLILDGIDYKSKNDSHELLYMEV